jgi:hypothetical protein
MRFHLYDIVVVNDNFDRSGQETNAVLDYLENLSMSTRRQIFVALVTDTYRTFDNMAAFNRSVNLTINVKNIDDVNKIIAQGKANKPLFDARRRRPIMSCEPRRTIRQDQYLILCTLVSALILLAATPAALHAQAAQVASVEVTATAGGARATTSLDSSKARFHPSRVLVRNFSAKDRNIAFLLLALVKLVRDVLFAPQKAA